MIAIEVLLAGENSVSAEASKCLGGPTHGLRSVWSLRPLHAPGRSLSEAPAVSALRTASSAKSVLLVLV